MHPEARPTRPIPPSGADERVLASGVERGRIRRLPEFIITPGREVASRRFAFWGALDVPSFSKEGTMREGAMTAPHDPSASDPPGSDPTASEVQIAPPGPPTGLPPGPESLCPACDYDLSAQVERASRVICPECGNTWHRDQLRAFLAGKPYWGPIPKILCGLPVAAALWPLIASMSGFSLGDSYGVAFFVVPLYLWPCMTWLAFMNSRRRHGEFSYIVAACLGVLLTMIATIALPLVAVMVLMILLGG